METTANNVPPKVETNNVSDRSSKKSGKEEKSKRKDDKNVDQIMKGLNNMESSEQKLAAMCKKYAEVMDENRKLQLTSKQLEKGLNVIQREKEQLQTDHSKAILTRSRLESLCRELQKQNKAVKEESLLKVREEEEKRKEVSAKFNSTLSEITTLMSSSNEKTNKLRDENVDITNKFRSICEQSGLQQQQVDKMNMQRKLEAELNEAKLTKQKLEFSAEKEVLLRDKQQLLMDLQEARTRVSDVLANEINLKAQVQLYADRYEEFQNALTRSNEVFGGFKGEMDKMSKKIVKLEKEAISWKTRWEKSHEALLEMATDKQQRDGELAHTNRQLAQLQKLCRTLQTERAGFLAQIKGLGKIPEGGGDAIGVDLALTEDCFINGSADPINLVETPVQSDTTDALVQQIKTTEKSSKVEELKLESPATAEETKHSKAGNSKTNKKVKLVETPISSVTKVDISPEPIKLNEPLVKETPIEAPTAIQESKAHKGGHPKTNKKAKLNAEIPKPKDEHTEGKSLPTEKVAVTPKPKDERTEVKSIPTDKAAVIPKPKDERIEVKSISTEKAAVTPKPKDERMEVKSNPTEKAAVIPKPNDERKEVKSIPTEKAAVIPKPKDECIEVKSIPTEKAAVIPKPNDERKVVKSIPTEKAAVIPKPNDERKVVKSIPTEKAAVIPKPNDERKEVKSIPTEKAAVIPKPNDERKEVKSIPTEKAAVLPKPKDERTEVKSIPTEKAAVIPKPKHERTEVKSIPTEKAAVIEKAKVKETEKVALKEQTKGLGDIKVSSVVNESVVKEVKPTKVVNQIEPSTKNHPEVETIPTTTPELPGVESSPKPSSTAPEVPPAKPDKVVPNENKKGKEGAKKRKK